MVILYVRYSRFLTRQTKMQETHPLPEGDDDTSSRYAASEMAKKQVKLLLQRIDDCCETMENFKSNHVKLMPYFDEGYVLTEKTVLHGPDGNDMFDVLCSCFNLFLSLPIFVIFLWTTSNINQLAPSGLVLTHFGASPPSRTSHWRTES